MTLFLVNRYFYPDESATSRMCTSLAFGLAARGVDVHIVCSRQRYDGGAESPERETVRGVAITRVGTTRFGRARTLGRAVDQAGLHASLAFALRRLVRPGDSVVVCTDPALVSVSVAAALAGRDVVLINWLLDLYPEIAGHVGVLPERGLIMTALQAIRDRSLRAARMNVAPMARMAEALAERGIPAGRLRVISHWSEGDAIRPIAAAHNPLRAEWELEGKIIVGYSGNLGRAHEFGTFLDAAAALSHRTDIVFLFVGAGHQRDRVEAEARRRGLDNVVMKPLQPRERIAETLALADIHLVCLLPHLESCVIPSKFYGILASGRPALFVGDPDGEIARLIAAGECGDAVTIGDWRRLAERVVAYADDPEARRAAGERARRLFDTGFTESVGHAAWERVLRDLDLISIRPADAPGAVVGTPA